MSNCESPPPPHSLPFFFKKKGDLENRAQLREPANILIFNTTRSDTAEYRCEVAAIDDQRDFDEILISLAVRGTVRSGGGQGQIYIVASKTEGYTSTYEVQIVPVEVETVQAAHNKQCCVCFSV